MQVPYGLLWTLIFFLFNHEYLLWDEEFLVALGLLGLYAFLFFSGRRLLRFALFHKAEGIYFYFYFLLELLGALSALVGSLLQALLGQWEAFYGLQLTLLLVHSLEGYLVQGQDFLGKIFFFSSFALNFACATLATWPASQELLLEGPSWEAGHEEATQDLELEVEDVEKAVGESATEDQDNPVESWSSDPVPEVFADLSLKSLLA